MNSATPRNALTNVRFWNDRIIELMWLSSIFLVPLFFSPPGWFAFFETPKIAIARAAAGGIVMIWALDLTLAVGATGRPSINDLGGRLQRWLAEEPLRWIAIAVAAFTAWVVASTLASSVPRIAFWGFEYGRDGQSAYGIASVVVVFFAIALRMRRPAQLWRLVAAGHRDRLARRTLRATASPLRRPLRPEPSVPRAYHRYAAQPYLPGLFSPADAP
jgi:hypothetical protein